MRSNEKWISEYLACLAAPSADGLDVNKARGIKLRNLPATLYRYQAIKPETLLSFEQDKVWVCSASEYNDPYDCAITFQSRKQPGL